MIRRLVSGLAGMAIILFAAVPKAHATDGHFLHGVGAINSAMGGAGIASPVSVLGTFYLNPAGLMAFDGTRIEFSMEMFKADRSVASSVPTPAGPFSGSTDSKKDWVPIPAFGGTYKLNSERVVLGISGLGIGGFGVDYPADVANPILTPQGEVGRGGFGQVFSNYQLLNVTPSVAWAATDKLWLGASFKFGWASLAVIPAPFASPDGAPPIPPAGPTVYYPQAGAADGAFGYGFSAGLLYHVNDMIALGASYTTEQSFSSFEWNSTHANPNDPSTFGTPRTLEFQLNVPAVAGAGIAVQALPSLLLSGDFKYYFYEDTEGFKAPANPFNSDGSVAGFGWTNIYSIATGLKFDVSPLVALYGGYNYSQNPVPDAMSMINVPAPAIVQNHATLGVGIRPTRHLEVTLGYYRAFENSGTGSFLSPAGEVPGTSVTNTLSEDSIQLMFSYVSRGQI